jgi:hypothetical protein
MIWRFEALFTETFTPSAGFSSAPSASICSRKRKKLRTIDTSIATVRLLRFDSTLILRRFRGKQAAGNRLKTGGKMSLPLRRYQRGYVYKTGKKQKVWYGMFRTDTRTAEGNIVRQQRNVRLGTLAELPTRTAALQALAQEMALHEKPSLTMTFSELVKRWKVAVVPTIKLTMNYYQKLLQAHLVPAFGQQEISNIGRYDVETFLANQSKKYSRNTLKTRRSDCHCAETTGALCDSCVVFGSDRSSEWGKPSESSGRILMATCFVSVERSTKAKQTLPRHEDSERSLPIPAVLLSRMKALNSTDWSFVRGRGLP